jgi:hydroxymethylbilane synthase
LKLRIATRKSQLALAQTRWVAAEVRKHHPDVEIEELLIVTKGDKILDKPLAEIGGKGLFVTEIEEALLDGRADLAVHSMKDVPAELADGLGIAIAPEREDPRDVLISSDGSGLFELTAGANIGTSSLRRQAQIRAQRNDLRCSTIRGNVNTRLAKLEAGEYDAIVLAAAGLRRLGLTPKHQVMEVSECIPAVGQGALGLETRLDDQAILELLAPLDHAPTRLAVEAERAFLSTMDGSCQLPIAGHARIEDEGGRIRLDAMVGDPTGEQLMVSGIERILMDPTPVAKLRAAYELGVEVGQEMLQKGAGELVDRARELSASRGWKH